MNASRPCQAGDLSRDRLNILRSCAHSGVCLSKKMTGLASAIAAGAVLLASAPAAAITTLSIKPITWDVIGLDSNKPSTDGPTEFPVAVRVKNTGGETANNVLVKLKLDPGGNQHIHPLDIDQITTPSLAVNQVADFYFVVKIDRPPGNTNAQTAGYFSVLGNAATTKKYTVEVSAANAAVASTPNNRQLYVEKILSQNRNSVAPVLELNNPNDPLLAGQVRIFTLHSDTATGYDQQETTIDFPPALIQILSVNANYTDPNCGCIITNETQFVEPLTAIPGKFVTNKVYVDGCGWVNDINDPDYHTNNSCTDDPALQDSPTGKIGGTIVTTYKVLVKQNVVDELNLSLLVHDHSGSSYHYNLEENLFSLEATNILVVKSAPVPPVEAGSDFSYFISVCNDSDTDANDVVLSDTLPACVTFKNAIPAPVNPAGNPLVWNLGTLIPGQCVDIEIQATAGCSEGECVNNAEVATSDLELNYADNSSSAPITIVDTTDPVITCPGNKTLECPGDTSVQANGTATATDACGVTVTHDDSLSDLCGNTGVLTRTWTATDDNGNVATCDQIITIVDTTRPTLSDVPDISVECPGNFDPTITGSATGGDTCGTVMVTHSDAPMSNGCGNTGNFIRTWMAADQCGNTTTTQQTITVVDTTDPSITDVPDATVECNSSTEPAATGTATGSDTCGSATISHTDGAMSNLCGNTGVFVRTWTATDECGNTATSQQTITVVDTTDPSITDVPDATVECNSSTEPAATGTATGSDTCGSATISHTDGTMSNLCGNTGVFVRTWTATDECGNTATSQQTITVVDTTDPSITDVPDATVECNSSTEPAATGTATGSDTCGSATISHTDGTMSNLCGNTGSFVRTWTATDECGNTATSLQTITVVDTTPPSISCPADILAPSPASGETCTVVDYPQLVASDTCGNVEVTFDPPSGTCFDCGTATVVTATARDECGNVSTCTFQVITGPCPEVGCSLTQGYWKNHPENWPVDSVTLGNRTYTKAELLQIFNLEPRKNGLIKLAHQLIATKLNIATGASDTCIISTVEAADTMIGNRIVPPIGGGGLTSKEVATLNDLLDSYNNGNLCVPHCDDLEPNPVVVGP